MVLSSLTHDRQRRSNRIAKDADDHILFLVTNHEIAADQPILERRRQRRQRVLQHARKLLEPICREWLHYRGVGKSADAVDRSHAVTYASNAKLAA